MLVFNPIVHDRTKLIVRIVALVLPLIILLPLISQTAFAQTTYVITDGDQTTVYTTFETNPAEVLDEAGFALDEGDVYTTQPGDGVSEITVQRSQQITVTYCGETLEVSGYGETLETLFNRLGLSVHGNYVVSLPMDTLTYDGMEVTVDNVVQMEQTSTVEIPYETIYCYDPTLPEGAQNVLIQGAAGQLLSKANVVYVNTVEKSRTVLEETVIQQPVNEIIVVGTGDAFNDDSSAPAIGDGVIVTSTGEVLTYSRAEQFKTTAYTHTDAGCDMTTATGTTVRVGTVAVDPTVIPYGTRMFIVSNDGKYVYGMATAEDCGGGIKGNHIDLYFPTTEACINYGVRGCTVYFLD